MALSSRYGAATRLIPLLGLAACPLFRHPANPACDRETISINPASSYDFGPVNVGASGTLELTLYQDYCGAVQVKSIATSGSPAFALLLSSDAGPDDEYARYANMTGLVVFAPTSVGAFAGVVTVTTSSPKDPTLQLNLTGQGIPIGPPCTTDGDCAGVGFCDGTYCEPYACGGFSNLPSASSGHLACAPESSACQGNAGWQLVDLRADPGNCGACGHACASGSGCSGGACGSCPGYRIGEEQDFAFDIPGFGLGNGLIIEGLALGDFNSDGRPDALIALKVSVREGDVVVPNPFSGLLILNDGDGGFASVPRAISLCDSPLRVADFNGDCLLDVAAGSILLGDGRGNFPTRNYLPDLGVDLRVADLNQDGKPDLVFAAQDESQPSGPFVMYGDGRGAFAALPSFAPGLQLYELASGDFDGTGRLGVAGFAFHADAGPLCCFSNEDGGSLAFEAAFADPGSDAGGLPASFAAAELAGAGHAALVYGEASSVIALPDPAHGSANAILLGLDAGFAELTVADLDLDGRADILATEGRGAWIFDSRSPIFIADGGFALDLWTDFGVDGGQLLAGRLQSVPVKLPPTFLQVADLNGDGIPDILAVSFEYSTHPSGSVTPRLMVFLGSCH